MKCLACGSSDLTQWATARDVEYRSVPDQFVYFRCGACDALSIDPLPRDRLAEIYPRNYYSFTEARLGLVQQVKDRLDRRWFRHALRAIRGVSLSALDVGGGTGEQLDTLRAADARVERTVVVDLDAAAGHTARMHGHEFVQSRIEDAAIDGTFDVILLLNLIEHVADPRAVLQKARELLSPDGLVLIKTPNYQSIDARLFRHHNWGGYHCPRHWVIFTAPSFHKLARAMGLRVVRFRYTQGAPFWAVSVIAWLADHSMAVITPDRPAFRHPLYAPLAAGFAAIDFVRGLSSPLSQMTFALARA